MTNATISPDDARLVFAVAAAHLLVEVAINTGLRPPRLPRDVADAIPAYPPPWSHRALWLSTSSEAFWDRAARKGGPLAAVFGKDAPYLPGGCDYGGLCGAVANYAIADVLRRRGQATHPLAALAALGGNVILMGAHSIDGPGPMPPASPS